MVPCEETQDLVYREGRNFNTTSGVKAILISKRDLKGLSKDRMEETTGTNEMV